MTHWKRNIFGVFLILIFFGSLGVLGWHVTKDRLFEQPAYRLSSENIFVPEMPEWIPSDFTAKVLLDSGLNIDVSILDETLPQKLSQAFSADPWVEEVQRVVIRFPSGADIQLTYRSPVALVEVPDYGLFPVDRNGVLLPTDYFINIAPEKRSEYPKIEGIRSSPIGTVGTPWGDLSVHTAAQLAAVIRHRISDWRIAVIKPTLESTPTGNRIVCYLKTVKGTEIFWGRFEPNDAQIDRKIKRLDEFVELFQSLDKVPPNFQPIDLSSE